MKSTRSQMLTMVALAGFTFLTGCDDPISSMIKGQQEATTKIAEIEANKEIEKDKIELERERMEHERQLEEMRLQAAQATGTTTGVGGAPVDQPAGSAEDTSTVNSQDSTNLENNGK